jgi:hypothetical protein
MERDAERFRNFKSSIFEIPDHETGKANSPGF